MARKNLNDTIHGDRAMIRGGSVRDDSTWAKDFFKEGFTDSIGTGSSSKRVSGSTLVDDDFRPKQRDSKYSSFRCHTTHPALKIPGTDLIITGGSCIEPAVSDADVYIGFDSGMRFTERHYPWKKGAEVLMKVPDMGIPPKPTEYRKLLDYTIKSLQEGKKVHCGCIGGHGRTGMFLAALVSLHGEKDAVTYVRENYCKKAVESSSQIAFLADEYGIKKVTGSKEGGSRSWEPSNKLKSTVGRTPSFGRVETFTPNPVNPGIFDPK